MGTKTSMTAEERAVSGAADEADTRTQADPTYVGAGVWHEHFIDSLHEQGWSLVRVPTGARRVLDTVIAEMHTNVEASDAHEERDIAADVAQRLFTEYGVSAYVV